MNLRIVRSDILLFVTATIWGFAFVAQRVGMEDVGPFTFNGIRFALGSLVLLPVILFTAKRKGELQNSARPDKPGKMLKVALLTGGLLFAGSSCQQVGLVYTTAGNAGFITGLYVVLVPLLGLSFGQKSSKGAWLGALCATAGLYLLSVTKDFTISGGDLLELLGAFFWAGHVLVIGRYSPSMDSLRLALFQNMACAVLSLITAGYIEVITAESMRSATWPILYGGVISVGIAYTLQIVGQKEAPSSHAAIIMSLESVFAAIGGWLILSEHLSTRQYIGCGLMLLGMLVSQLWRAGFPMKESESVKRTPSSLENEQAET